VKLGVRVNYIDIRKCISQKYTVEPTFYNIILKYTPYGQAEWSSKLMNVVDMMVLSEQTTSSTGILKVLINRKCDCKLAISRKEKAFNGGDNSVNYYIQAFLKFVGMSVKHS